MQLMRDIEDIMIRVSAVLGLAGTIFVGALGLSGNYKLQFKPEKQVEAEYTNKNPDAIAQCKKGEFSKQFKQVSHKHKTISLFDQTAIAQPTDYMLDQDCKPYYQDIRDDFYAAQGLQLTFSDPDANPGYAWAYQSFFQVTQEILKNISKDHPHMDIPQLLNNQHNFKEMISKLNSFINNNITYQTDNETFMTGAYVASAAETAYLEKGDCEDYAMLKYQLLKDLGVPVSRMYVTFVGDTNQEQVNHAVLLVNIAPDGERPNWYVLDNNYSIAIPQSVPGYKPHLAFNDHGAWIFSHNVQKYDHTSANAIILDKKGQSPS